MKPSSQVMTAAIGTMLARDSRSDRITNPAAIRQSNIASGTAITIASVIASIVICSASIEPLTEVSIDNPAALMDIDLTWRLAGTAYDHSRYRERLCAVTREQVVEAMRCVEPEIVYLLRPE